MGRGGPPSSTGGLTELGRQAGSDKGGLRVARLAGSIMLPSGLLAATIARAEMLQKPCCELIVWRLIKTLATNERFSPVPPPLPSGSQRRYFHECKTSDWIPARESPPRKTATSSPPERIHMTVGNFPWCCTPMRQANDGCGKGLVSGPTPNRKIEIVTAQMRLPMPLSTHP